VTEKPEPGGEGGVIEGDEVESPPEHPPSHEDIPVRGGKREPSKHERSKDARSEGT